MIISLLHCKDTLTVPKGFTEGVMARLEKKPSRNKNRILHWLCSPLHVYLTGTAKWALAFGLILLIWGGLRWQNLKIQNIYQQMHQLEQRMENLQNQPVVTRFFFHHPTAQSIHLVGTFNNWQKEKQYQADKQQLEQEMVELNLEHKALKSERKRLAEEIDETSLNKYEKIRTQRSGMAVVTCQGESCPGCHMFIPPQTINEVLQTGEIRYCSYCNRIIYCEQELNTA